MDFKEYYHKKLDEDLAQQQSIAAKSYEDSQESIGSDSGMESVVARYVGNGNVKEGLKKLGSDLGEAIFKYATERYVTDEEFASADDKAKYVNVLTQKIQQTANGTLVELLKHVAVDICNTKNAITM